MIKKTETKLFINNIILFIVFLYTINILFNSYGTLYIKQYDNPLKENYKLNMTEIYKNYPDLRIEDETINNFDFPYYRLIILLSVSLILLLNQYFYIHKKYLMPLLKYYVKKKEEKSSEGVF